jgi:hypothetical protein
MEEEEDDMEETWMRLFPAGRSIAGTGAAPLSPEIAVTIVYPRPWSPHKERKTLGTAMSFPIVRGKITVNHPVNHPDK